MTSSFFLVLVIATYCSHVFAIHFVPCPDADKLDCPCMEQMRRAMSGCRKNPGCNGRNCGPFQISPEFYMDASCPTVDSKCLRYDSCDGKSPEFKTNFVKCTYNLDCSIQCVNLQQSKYPDLIKKCKGTTLCEKKLHALIHGPFNCQEPIDEIFYQRFNDTSRCPCGVYSNTLVQIQ
ncbi:uncharacterized protein LOC111064298 [Nilaparvata lugens]|uniref:uncharacterized protein LOC111064298 n=1 Tax=Nilaparvata lugens TaxID=108931 RepID=UPI00193D961F|nr:uncharacterized protein LOC111064298 [Nilaparvata lugens]